MKFYSKLNQYKCSNLVYDIEKEIAYSYEWYQIAKRVKGTMLLNYYTYSNTTIRHAYKLRKLLNQLGIQYVEIEAPKGLQCLQSAIEHYEFKIEVLEHAIAKPKSRKTTNEERKAQIHRMRGLITIIKELM